MKEEIKTLLQQVNGKELIFAKFQVIYDDKKTSIFISKGKKAIEIKYNYGSDLYDLRLWQNIRENPIDQHETMQSVFAGDLRDIITAHFPNFKYIMESFIISRG